MIESVSIAVQNPYPGLRPFDEENAHLFFGRKEQTGELLGRLDEHRFVAVLGLSGCGKSSLIRAGLIPVLRREVPAEGGSYWRIVKMRPGADPIRRLSEGLDKALGKDSERFSTLCRSSFGLIRAARKGRSAEEKVLVVVDQFEEVFRQPDESSSDFVRLLLTAVQEAQTDYQVYVVLAIRTDYLGDCARFRDLPEALNNGQYIVPRLTPDQRRVAITEPAKVFGIEVEAQLLQQLLLDAGDDPDQLPILQHLLMRMWNLNVESGGPRRITLAEYERAGCWKDAIDNHGAELLDSLSGGIRKQIAKRIFQRVTELGGRDRGRRRPARLSELISVATPPGAEADVRAVVERFMAPGSNFLASPDWQIDSDPVVEITHESLIRQWSVLMAWAHEESESAQWYRRVEDRLRTEGAHLTGSELRSAQNARESGNWSQAWASRYSEHEEFMNVVSFLEGSSAVTESWAREIAAYALDSLADKPGKSGALVAQAMNASLRFVTPPVHASPVLFTLRGHTGSLTGTAFSANGNWLATSSVDQTARLWDAASRKELMTLRGHKGYVYAVSFSFDGRRLATASGDQTAKLWDAASGREIATLRNHTGNVCRVTFSPDGTRLATASWDRTAKVWDALNGKELMTLSGHKDFVSGVAFSPDCKLLATASLDHTLKLWDATNGKELVTVGGHKGSVYGVAFSPDGKRIATASEDRTAKVWDMERISAVRTKALTTFRGRGLTGSQQLLNPDDSWLTIGCADLSAEILGAERIDASITLRGRGFIVSRVVFSPDGRWIATSSWDHTTATVWDAASGAEIVTLRGHTGRVEDVAFSPDSELLATAGADREAKVWAVLAASSS
jgi:WD40 repeat protein